MRERLALVIPAWNEAHRFRATPFLDFVASQNTVDLYFVDDGSVDGTGELLDTLQEQQPVRMHVLHLEQNQGKAEAVRLGLRRVLDAGYGLVGYLDADLAAPLDTVLLLRAVLLEDPALVMAMGSRVKLLGWEITRSERRHYLGRIFATFASLALRLPVYDTQCGAKAMRCGAALDTALATPFMSRWLFDVELLARLRDAGARMREVPLPVWKDPGGSSVRGRDFLRAPVELWRIWRRYPVDPRRR